MTNSTQSVVLEPSNDGEFHIGAARPYRAEVLLHGTSDLLFHRWSVEDVAEKAAAAKGSATKKVDNVEAYVYRCSDGTLGIPGEYVRQALIGAARYRQDPRSPRKSAMDLYRAGVVSLTEVASLGCTSWDFLDRRRVQVQRASVTRARPAMLVGWEAEFVIQILVPEYIRPDDLRSAIEDAGRLVGIGDFRPSYGRFALNRFQVLEDT